ncbi:PilZ domain-containing protein [Methylocystis echinoides]|jgi:hypothetical protein|uniref:PilZ domain-containing protein n=1 Tax=Methylocystis echinoides TaxID=29468 RepID=UPI00343CC167
MAATQLEYNQSWKLHESRRFQRVPVTLFGRCMLESRREYPCRTLEMSPGDMTLMAPVRAAIGEKVIVYLDQIGRFAGVATDHTEAGFALTMNLSAAKRDRLADQLTWFANRHAVNLPDDRRHERIVPIMPRTLLRLPDGQETIVRIRDLSLSGVGLETEARPDPGLRIVVGATPAIVVRHFAGGIGAEFETPFRPGEIDEGTRL